MSDFERRLKGKSLLIFDLDGTLVDSSPIHARAFSDAFAPLGIAVDYGTISGMTTVSAIDQLLARAGQDRPAEEREQLRLAKQQRALALMDEELRPVPGAVDFVAAARRHFACALCTSASPGSARSALARVGMDGWFSPVVTSADVRNGKPDPEGFLLAAARAGVEPARALVFEDSESGLAAARAAGVDAVAIGPDTPGWPELLATLESSR